MVNTLRERKKLPVPELLAVSRLAGSSLFRFRQGRRTSELFSSMDLSCCPRLDVVGHHAPYKAGQVPGNSCYGNVFLFPMADHPIIPASHPNVGSVGIRDNLTGIAGLSRLQIFGFMADVALADALRSFDQQSAQMGIACF